MPTETWIDREDVGIAARPRDVDGVGAAEIDADDFRVALARDERALAV